MPTYRVELAPIPTAVMNALYTGPARYLELRDSCDATSVDMNLLVSLRFIQQLSDGTWALTPDGRAALVPALTAKGEQ